MVFMDNFFSNVKLFTALKDLSIGAVGTAKLGSGFPVELLEIRELSTKKNVWGMKAYTTASEDVLCLVWQDLGTIQIMTTVHSVEDIETFEFISSQKRRGIPSNSVIETPDGNQALPIHLPIREYNKHMGGSDAKRAMQVISFGRYTMFPLLVAFISVSS